jgi:hypothetical protein
MTQRNCDDCDRICSEHGEQVEKNKSQERRLDKLDEIVKEIPRMQARVHMLMYILIATMTILISISGFSFLQLLDFKKTYFKDRQEHTQLHSEEALEQEQRYVDLINKLGNRISSLEARHFLYPNNED